MKTDALIALLSGGSPAADPHVLRRRSAMAIGWGAFGAALLMAVLLGVRPDLEAAARLPMFWIKLAFPSALAAIAPYALLRLARPGARLGWLPAALAAPVAVVWLLAVAAALGASPAVRSEMLFGDTWRECLVNITILSVPAFAGLMWALKDYAAPTRPALAGGAAGLLAGALGAAVYALHCPELAAPFIAVWYMLGMLIPATLGALIGSRLLRW